MKQQQKQQRGKTGQNPREVKSEMLTRDHSPDRVDELARIQAAGGFVSATAGVLCRWHLLVFNRLK